MTPGSTSSQRERNRLQVIDELRRSGAVSRAEIARRTGLSRSTISSLVSDLQSDGLVEERDGATAGSQGGRPGVLLSLRPEAGTALGIDFGHTHLRVALADLSYTVLAERQVPLDVDHSATDALDAAVDLVDEVLAVADLGLRNVIGAGMGLPGPIDADTGEVGSSVILPGWAGIRPQEEITRRLGVDVQVDNDANLGALGELAFGAGRGSQYLVYVKVASGIGAGLIYDGRVFRGASGIAGELGHVLVDAGGPVCRCGNRGCLETRAAAPALLELLRPTFGAHLEIADLVTLSAQGTIGVNRALTDAGRLLGRALSNLFNVLNPDRLVVGGELAAVGEPLLEGVRESLGRYALPAVAEAVQIDLGVLGQRAEVLGALALVIADTEQLSSARIAGRAA